MRNDLTPGRIKAARIVAIAADVLELSIFPVFFEGALSPANDVLDVAVAIVLFALLGWHWAFLPAFAAEMVPFFSLVPTWTAAVMLVTQGQGVSGVVDVTPTAPLAIPPSPAPPPEPPSRG